MRKSYLGKKVKRRRSARKQVILISIVVFILACLVLFFLLRKDQHQIFQAPENMYLAGDYTTTTIQLPDGHSVRTALSAKDVHAQGWLGTQLTDLTDEIKQNLHFQDSAGVYVQDTLRNSPAQTAGILPGDIITKINNTNVQDVLPTLNLVARLQPGEVYPIEVFRKNEYIAYQVKIAPKP